MRTPQELWPFREWEETLKSVQDINFNNQYYEKFFKEKNSKFFGYAFPVLTEDTVKLHLENLKKELQTKQEEIVKPIMEKVRASIQKVGKAKGFQYVLDGSTLLLADGTNITVDVKKDLGF